MFVILFALMVKPSSVSTGGRREAGVGDGRSSRHKSTDAAAIIRAVESTSSLAFSRPVVATSRTPECSALESSDALYNHSRPTQDTNRRTTTITEAPVYFEGIAET